MSAAEEAVTSLEALGLTEYEARCFVALTRISTGTAKEVSQVADVPRSRVYDTIERLERKGLVTVQQSDPREYKSVPVEMACRRLREDHTARIDAAENALEQLEEPESKDDEGMWSINRYEHVTDRIVLFLEEAIDTVHYLVPVMDVVDQRIREALQSAADRGVRVVIEVPTREAKTELEEVVPDANIVVAEDLRSTNNVQSEFPAQLLMVDQRAVVAAAVKENDLPDVVQEVAVWTYGRDHGFAAWTRELLDDRLEKRDDWALGE
ncbi:TrmB family transcriptional regulator [Natronorubrum halophilum]|uniref:TrmB family transcriptional regulator n=1 Tax=Natronorubrum halophilum TaxID=1702106 RepID=UPI000EF6D78A|nr:helix-turn-helix domain-containing protein [Natronorubrum halophilum]